MNVNHRHTQLKPGGRLDPAYIRSLLKQQIDLDKKIDEELERGKSG
jgi:hypothetical protein